MKIIFTDNNTVVGSAVDAANSLLKDSTFYDKIAAHNAFDMSSVPPAYIANEMKTSTLEFTVKIFYPKFLDIIKYRKTYAYTDGNFPNTLFLNARKLDRTTADLAATVIHESVHAIDDSDPNASFGHGDNSAAGKDNTAPYWIGNLAYQLISNTPSTISNFSQTISI